MQMPWLGAETGEESTSNWLPACFFNPFARLWGKGGTLVLQACSPAISIGKQNRAGVDRICPQLEKHRTQIFTGQPRSARRGKIAGRRAQTPGPRFFRQKASCPGQRKASSQLIKSVASKICRNAAGAARAVRFIGRELSGSGPISKGQAGFQAVQVQGAADVAESALTRASAVPIQAVGFFGR